MKISLILVLSLFFNLSHTYTQTYEAINNNQGVLGISIPRDIGASNYSLALIYNPTTDKFFYLDGNTADSLKITGTQIRKKIPRDIQGKNASVLVTYNPATGGFYYYQGVDLTPVNLQLDTVNNTIDYLTSNIAWKFVRDERTPLMPNADYWWQTSYIDPTKNTWFNPAYLPNKGNLVNNYPRTFLSDSLFSLYGKSFLTFIDTLNSQYALHEMNMLNATGGQYINQTLLNTNMYFYGSNSSNITGMNIIRDDNHIAGATMNNANNIFMANYFVEDQFPNDGMDSVSVINSSLNRNSAALSKSIILNSYNSAFDDDDHDYIWSNGNVKNMYNVMLNYRLSTMQGQYSIGMNNAWCLGDGNLAIGLGNSFFNSYDAYGDAEYFPNSPSTQTLSLIGSASIAIGSGTIGIYGKRTDYPEKLYLKNISIGFNNNAYYEDNNYNNVLYGNFINAAAPYAVAIGNGGYVSNYGEMMFINMPEYFSRQNYMSNWEGPVNSLCFFYGSVNTGGVPDTIHLMGGEKMLESEKVFTKWDRKSTYVFKATVVGKDLNADSIYTAEISFIIQYKDAVVDSILMKGLEKKIFATTNSRMDINPVLDNITGTGGIKLRWIATGLISKKTEWMIKMEYTGFTDNWAYPN